MNTETADNTETAETKRKPPSTGFYEAKGMIRRTLIFNKGYPEKLAKLSDDFNLTQGEVVEVLLDHFNPEAMKPHFESKGGNRPEKLTKTELMKKMKGLTPEKLAAIEKILAGGDTAD